MSMEIPDELANLDANGGIYAVWMLLQHLGIDADIQQLIEVCLDPVSWHAPTLRIL